MNRALKIILILIASVLILMLGAKFYIQWRFDDIVNGNTSSKYIIDYQDISIDYTLNGITLENVTLVPRTTPDSAGTMVNARVKKARMEGLNLFKVLFSEKLQVDQLRFEQPSIVVFLNQDTTRRQQQIQKGVSGLFGDIIQSASLKNFSIQGGKSIIHSTVPDTTFLGSVGRVDFEAKDIRTDSVRLNFIIPFQVGQLTSRMDSLEYRLGEYRRLTIASIDFSSVTNELQMKDITMQLDTGWRALSRTYSYHTDIIEFSLSRLMVRGINMFDIYGDSFKLHATSLELDSLDLNDYRNKSLPEPDRQEKPMFKSLVDKIPIPIDVDSILVRNSSVSYTEVPESGGEGGTIRFDNISGYIKNVTSDSMRQKEVETFHARLEALVNRGASLTFDLVVPYSDEHFYLDADIEPFSMDILNQTMVPLASIRIESGRVEAFRLRMDASLTHSNNTLNLDYSDLKLRVLGNSPGENEKGLLSSIANAFVKKNNDPGTGTFKDIEYVTERNVRRSPFNYMWLSIKDGVREIMPSTAGSLFIPKDNKNEQD